MRYKKPVPIKLELVYKGPSAESFFRLQNGLEMLVNEKDILTYLNSKRKFKNQLNEINYKNQ